MSSGRRGFRGTAENSKTKICLRWKSGHCRFGDRCNFAHGERELRRRGSISETPWTSELGARGHTGLAAVASPQRGQGMHSADSLRQLQQLSDPVADSYLGACHPMRPGAGHIALLAPDDSMPTQSVAALSPRPLPRPGLAEALDPMVEGLLVGQAGLGQHAALGGAPHSSELWAQQGYPILGSHGWTQYRDKQTGEAYYHNQHTHETTWDPPPGWSVM